MNVREVWTFIAGDSVRAPAGVAVAIAVAVLMTHVVPAAGAFIGVAFFAVIAAALIAAVFEP